MIEISGGAEWDFGFDMIGATTVGVMNSARAEAEVDSVGGEAEVFLGVELGLVETKLGVRCGLNFV